MALLSATGLRIAFGGPPLLDDATLHIETGERVGLLGRNGEGKSTLLSILAGRTEPNGGELAWASGTRVALLEQDVPAEARGTVGEVIAAGVRGHGDPHHEVQRLSSLLSLDPDLPFEELSGGQKRRVLLGRALAGEPDLLILDEPTNHLDLEHIAWLENFLRRFRGTLLFVTHDRAFLQALATRIVELDRGRLTSWQCDYPTYLERKEALLSAEEAEWQRLDRKLEQEEAWIRQGIKARRTRNEGRVRALEELRRRRRDRRTRTGEVRMEIQEAQRSGNRVMEVRGVSFSWEGEPLIRDFDATIMRGDKVGVIGPNGAGKTTLLALLLGKLTPDAGSVRHGARLEVAYFDQHRDELDPDATVADSVGFGSDHVAVDGQRRHVLAYLQDFLFSKDRARQPVRSLSGGERNRLLLARLFTTPANVLVLDEPTNDLDSETLELLEARLVAFSGTVLTVSHDRRFLDNLCTSSLVFEGDGVVKEYVGGYSDWRGVVDRRRSEAAEAQRAAQADARAAGAGRRSTRGQGSRSNRLTFNEKRELEALPPRIEALETELAELHATVSDPDFYKRDPADIRAATARVPEVEQEIESLFERWSELGEKEH